MRMPERMRRSAGPSSVTRAPDVEHELERPRRAADVAEPSRVPTAIGDCPSPQTTSRASTSEATSPPCPRRATRHPRTASPMPTSIAAARPQRRQR